MIVLWPLELVSHSCLIVWINNILEPSAQQLEQRHWCVLVILSNLSLLINLLVIDFVLGQQTQYSPAKCASICTDESEFEERLPLEPNPSDRNRIKQWTIVFLNQVTSPDGLAAAANAAAYITYYGAILCTLVHWLENCCSIWKWKWKGNAKEFHSLRNCRIGHGAICTDAWQSDRLDQTHTM